jgi:hypothetical protein
MQAVKRMHNKNVIRPSDQVGENQLLRYSGYHFGTPSEWNTAVRSFMSVDSYWLFRRALYEVD